MSGLVQEYSFWIMSGLVQEYSVWIMSGLVQEYSVWILSGLVQEYDALIMPRLLSVCGLTRISIEYVKLYSWIVCGLAVICRVMSGSALVSDVCRCLEVSGL